jgi:DNA invertase Pin-like site-specific DNA recombinase
MVDRFLTEFARSTRDLLNVMDAVGKAGAGFRSLADHWADTTTPHGRLVSTVLGGLAEFERELIRARTDEGRRRAKARGVRFGRKLKPTLHQRAEAISRRVAGEPLAEIGRSTTLVTRRFHDKLQAHNHRLRLLVLHIIHRRGAPPHVHGTDVAWSSVATALQARGGKLCQPRSLISSSN